MSYPNHRNHINPAAHPRSNPYYDTAYLQDPLAMGHFFAVTISFETLF
jgi:hypothetical protein